MANELKGYTELTTGANVLAEDAIQPYTGNWRMGLKPRVDLSKCVDCMLCWINCPDTAILIEKSSFFGFDYDFCKGCELCEEVCPTKAIEMIPEVDPVPEYGRYENDSYL